MPKGSFLQKHWAKKRAQIAASKAAGHVTVTVVQGRLHVTCPYNAAFVGGAKALSGTYNERSGVWSFRLEAQGLVSSLLRGIYGEDIFKAPQDPIEVKPEPDGNYHIEGGHHSKNRP